MKNLDKTEVMILGTIHGLHSNNSFYSYEDIFSIIDNFKPSVIGVEIRKEDISQSREYLNKNYPYEMIEAKFRYEKQYTICGFDWLGEDIEGKLIPEKYFETSEFKMLERKFAQEQNYKKEKDIIEAIDKVRFPLIMNRTADQCNDGKYDIACEILYSQLDIMLKGTPYEIISTFFTQRQNQIDTNMINIIEENKGERIIFLTGIDHKVFAAKAISSHFNDEVIIADSGARR